MTETSGRTAACTGEDERLALRPRQAAKVLQISERKLWSLKASGEIPFIQLGRATLYPVEALSRWLDEQANKGVGA
jgi:excisionase family DNA binding protein